MTFLPATPTADYKVNFLRHRPKSCPPSTTQSTPATYADGDLNGEGIVNFFDLSLVLSTNYNTGPYWTPPAPRCLRRLSFPQRLRKLDHSNERGIREPIVASTPAVRPVPMTSTALPQGPMRGQRR